MRALADLLAAAAEESEFSYGWHHGLVKFFQGRRDVLPRLLRMGFLLYLAWAQWSTRKRRASRGGQAG